MCVPVFWPRNLWSSCVYSHVFASKGPLLAAVGSRRDPHTTDNGPLCPRPLSRGVAVRAGSGHSLCTACLPPAQECLLDKAEPMTRNQGQLGPAWPSASHRTPGPRPSFLCPGMCLVHQPCARAEKVPEPHRVRLTRQSCQVSRAVLVGKGTSSLSRRRVPGFPPASPGRRPRPAPRGSGCMSLGRRGEGRVSPSQKCLALLTSTTTAPIPRPRQEPTPPPAPWRT